MPRRFPFEPGDLLRLGSAPVSKQSLATTLSANQDWANYESGDVRRAVAIAGLPERAPEVNTSFRQRLHRAAWKQIH